MNNKLVTSVLVGALFCSTFATAALIYAYNESMSKLPLLQQKGAAVDSLNAIVGSLLRDADEYAKTTKSSEIDRIIQFAQTGGKSAVPAKAPVK